MTADDATTLGERLIRVEPDDEELRRQYEERKLALRERRFTPAQRALGWIGLPVSLAISLALGWRLLTTETAEPREWIVLQAVSVAGLLAISAWTAHVLLRGRATWRADRAFQAGAVVLACGLALAAFEVARSLDDHRAALGMLGFAVVVLAGAGCGLAVDHFRRVRLEMRVARLENELRVAESANPIAALRRARGEPGGGEGVAGRR